MKKILLLTLALSTSLAWGACTTGLPLKGFVSVDTCATAGPDCVPAPQALYQYVEAQKDDGPDVLSIALHGSPWRLYDAEDRILEISELASIIRAKGSVIKRVEIYSSWSAAAPDRHSKALTQRLSLALNGMQVKGLDGFAWYSPDGAVHTTHQAFTGAASGPYHIPKGKPVMASLVKGWLVEGQSHFAKTGDAAGLLAAGVAADIYLLCPERALAAFDAAAALGNAVAAFNAAIMRLERGNSGDKAAAVKLLKQAAARGDLKARERLKTL